MDTPRARSPRPLSSKPTAPLPRPPPPPLSPAAAASPSHDLPSASASSSPIGAHLLQPLSMYRAPVGRVGSDLSHNSSFSKPNKATTIRHPTASYYYGSTTGSKDDRDKKSKNSRTTSPFISGLGGGAWRRKESTRSSDDTAGGGKKKPAAEEEKRRKDSKAKRATVDLGQWVKKRVTAVVDQLRSSLYHHRHQAEREEQRRRRRPHSFSGHHGPMSNNKERERWTTPRRRGLQQHLSSAPASLRVSPANSGHLSVKAVSSASEEDSRTMEELQSAIDAAIAHCKNSMSRARADDDDRTN